MADQPSDSAREASCPHLGLAEDVSTHCLFAAASHRCYFWPEPARVDEQRQIGYCLSSEHETCPRLTGREQPHHSRWQPLHHGRQRRKSSVEIPFSTGRGKLVLTVGAASAGVLAMILLASPLGLLGRAEPVETASSVTALPAPLPTAPLTSAAETGDETPTATLSGSAAGPGLAEPAAPLPEWGPTASPQAASIMAAPSPVERTATTYQGTPLPAPTASSRPAVPSPTAQLTAGPSGQKFYLVLRGDTLWGLSMKFGVTVDAMLKANGLTQRNFIQAGQRLVIPGP